MASPDDPDTISLRFVFIPDGQPMPDILHEFREPIILRAQFFPPTARPRPAPPAAGPSVTTLPGSYAPIPVQASVAALPGPAEPPHPDELPLLILSATGAVLAEGSAIQLSAQALRLAQVIPKTHPVFLAAAGVVTAFASLALLLEHLAPMAGDRNAGLPPPLRAYSQRARATAANQDASDKLDPDERRAHHLIGVHAAQQHTPLLEAAARAGWRMDAPANVIALPRTRAAQEKLARAGIQLPLHDNRHPVWNQDVSQELKLIEQELNALDLDQDSEDYAIHARQLLERLQRELRGKALEMDRIVRNDDSISLGYQQLWSDGDAA